MKNKTIAISDEAVDNLTGLIDSFIELNNRLYDNEIKPTQKIMELLWK